MPIPILENGSVYSAGIKLAGTALGSKFRDLSDSLEAELNKEISIKVKEKVEQIISSESVLVKEDYLHISVAIISEPNPPSEQQKEVYEDAVKVAADKLSKVKEFETGEVTINDRGYFLLAVESQEIKKIIEEVEINLEKGGFTLSGKKSASMHVTLALLEKHPKSKLTPAEIAANQQIAEAFNRELAKNAFSLENAKLGMVKFERGKKAELIYTPALAEASTQDVSPNQVSIKIQKVSAFSAGKDDSSLQNREVHLNCPPRILKAFQDLIKGTKVLGTLYKNPYTGEEEEFPSKAEDFTARHLQILARNEINNIAGKMEVDLYNNLLTKDQVARLRCLVKATTVSGMVSTKNYGGYPDSNDKKKLEEEVSTLLIDQSGLQWQGDLRNTGGMFFYPYTLNSSGHEYSQWQKDMYKVMHNVDRPDAPVNPVEVNWKIGGEITKGMLDLDGVSLGIKQEFLQALAAVVTSTENNQGDINFKYLKAGMGFFSEGLKDYDKEKLEQARLKGIKDALTEITGLSDEDRKKILGKVKRLELPYTEADKFEMDDIDLIGRKIGLTAVVATKRDALQPTEGYLNAVTNCGDPHAMIGNEGGYQSVDAAIYTNTEASSLNVCYNDMVALHPTPEIENTGGSFRLSNVESIASAPSGEVGQNSSVAQVKKNPESPSVAPLSVATTTLPQEHSQRVDNINREANAVRDNGNNGSVSPVKKTITPTVKLARELATQKNTNEVETAAKFDQEEHINFIDKFSIKVAAQQVKVLRDSNGLNDKLCLLENGSQVWQPIARVARGEEDSEGKAPIKCIFEKSFAEENAPQLTSEEMLAAVKLIAVANREQQKDTIALNDFATQNQFKQALIMAVLIRQEGMASKFNSKSLENLNNLSKEVKENIQGAFKAIAEASTEEFENKSPEQVVAEFKNKLLDLKTSKATPGNKRS